MRDVDVRIREVRWKAPGKQHGHGQNEMTDVLEAPLIETEKIEIN